MRWAAAVLIALVLVYGPQGEAQVAPPVPGVTAPAASPSWWQENQTFVAILGLAGTAITTFLGHRLGVKQTNDAKTAARDNADLTAIQAGYKSVQDLMNLLTTQATQRDGLIAENARNQERLTNQDSRIAALEAKHAELTTHLASCTGGTPCPLAQYRRSA